VLISNNWRVKFPIGAWRTSLRELRNYRALPKHWRPSRAVISGGLAFVGITAVNLIVTSNPADLGTISTSFGALATLLYAAPSSRLSRPRNVICGNLVGAAMGMLISLAVNDDNVTNTWFTVWLPGAAVALTVAVNALFDVTHPPSGAVALFAALPTFNKSKTYILAPILLGDAVLLLLAMLLNNFVVDEWFEFPFVKRRSQ